jgi:hypothetical protein
LVIDFDQAQVRASIARACLGQPEQVRAGVKMTDAWDAEHVTVDWMKKRRGFTRWLARG